MARPGDTARGTLDVSDDSLDDQQVKLAETTELLARLNREAKATGEHLLELGQALAEARRDIDGSLCAQVHEANGQLVQAVLHAETIAEDAIERLDSLAFSSQRDPLTDTPNRALTLDRMNNALAMARRHGTRLAVLFIDLDHFKQVNDTLGHEVGDQVLQLVAKRLKAMVRDVDTVSRHGGDEFLVLLPEISQASDAEVMAFNILSAVTAPCLLGDHAFHPSASLGISLFPDDGDDAATLIGHADAAMYASKRRGHGAFAFYSQQDADAAAQAQPPSDSAAHTAALPPLRMQDLREANAQLLLSALAAQAHETDAIDAHRRQSERMAMVAHELRNPLTPIRIAASLLSNRGAAESPTIPRLQSIIERQVQHMTRLVEDLLDGSRLSTGKLRLERSNVDIIGILEMAAQTCRPGMETRHQTLTLQLPPGPLEIHGDPIRLAQVFCNLLVNASKYTPMAGEITLAAQVLESSIELSVADNGAGISAEGLHRIFELFAQDDHAMTMDNRGLGIGLAVVRELVDAHGGTVFASSAGKDQGSRFVVTLPMAGQPVARLAAGSADEADVPVTTRGNPPRDV